MANGKAELTLEQLRRCRQALSYLYGAEGVVPEHANLNWLAAAIAEAERVDKLHGWVPVSERLPMERPEGLPEMIPEDEDELFESRCYAVLIEGRLRDAMFGVWTNEDGEVQFGWWWSDDDFEGWCDASGITHWREIPPLPEGGGARGDRLIEEG